MSNGLPPPPDLLGIAMQAQQVRRQAEQDRLNQLMMVENLRQNAIRQGQDAIAQGIEAKDALGMLSYRDPLVEAQLKAMESAAKKNKEQQLNSQAAQQLIPGLTRLGVEAPNTEAFGQGVSQLAQLLGQDAGPILESISAQSKMAPTLGALNQIQSQQEEETAFMRMQRQEREKARIQQQKELNVAAGKLNLDAAFQVQKEEDAVLSRQIANGELTFEEAQSQLVGSPNAAFRAQRVFVGAIRDRIALEPYNEVVETLRDQGVPVNKVPKSLLRRLTTGVDSNGNAVPATAFLSPTTGLPLYGSETSEAYKMVNTLEAGLNQLNSIEAMALYLAENRGNTSVANAVMEQLKAELNAGLVNGDVAIAHAIRNLGIPGIARATGEVGSLTEPEQQRAMSALPSIIAQLSNPKTGLAQIGATRRFVQNRVRTAFDAVPTYRADPSIYTSRFEAARQKAIEEQLNGFREQFGGESRFEIREVAP